MASTQCNRCSAWSVSELTYHELCQLWNELIDGQITEGYEKRYKKEGALQRQPWDEVKLAFKYCAKGILTRFYVAKNANDTMAKKMVRDCPGFSASEIGETSWSCAKQFDFPVIEDIAPDLYPVHSPHY